MFRNIRDNTLIYCLLLFSDISVQLSNVTLCNISIFKNWILTKIGSDGHIDNFTYLYLQLPRILSRLPRYP